MPDDSKAAYFEQAWKVLDDIASACREFNELQFKYRQLALSIVLAAYAAVGYFWVSAEADVTAGESKARVSEQASITAAVTPPARQVTTAPHAPRTPVPPAAADPPKALSHLSRLNIIFAGIGLISALSAFIISTIDGRYHVLLEAMFVSGRNFEASLSATHQDYSPLPLPPFIHTSMSKIRSPSVINVMTLFYAVLTLASLAPWFGFALLHPEVVMQDWGNTPGAFFAKAAIAIAVLYLLSLGFHTRQQHKLHGNPP